LPCAKRISVVSAAVRVTQLHFSSSTLLAVDVSQVAIN